MKPQFCVAVCALSVAAAAPAQVFSYDASEGTIPIQQGWSFAGGSLIGTVTGDTLSYGPTSSEQLGFWGYQASETVDFSVDTWAIEAEVRLTGTFIGNFNGFRRGGFVLTLTDDFGRDIVADLGSDAASIRNDESGVDDPFEMIDLESDFHLIRLEAGPEGGRLLIDGDEILTLPLRTDGSGIPVTTTWGESSDRGSTQLTEVTYVNLIPSPGALSLGAIGGLALLRRRR